MDPSLKPLSEFSSSASSIPHLILLSPLVTKLWPQWPSFLLLTTPASSHLRAFGLPVYWVWSRLSLTLCLSAHFLPLGLCPNVTSSPFLHCSSSHSLSHYHFLLLSSLFIFFFFFSGSLLEERDLIYLVPHFITGSKNHTWHIDNKYLSNEYISLFSFRPDPVNNILRHII